MPACMPRSRAGSALGQQVPRQPLLPTQHCVSHLSSGLAAARRCPIADLAVFQQLRQLTLLVLSLSEPAWCRVKLRAGWPACLSTFHLGSPVESCQLQGLGEHGGYLCSART